MRRIIITNRGKRLILRMGVFVAILISIPFIYNLSLDFYQQNLKINKSSIEKKNDNIDMDKSMTEIEVLVNKLNQPFNVENPISSTSSSGKNPSTDNRNVDTTNNKINSPVNVKIKPQIINDSINRPFGN